MALQYITVTELARTLLDVLDNVQHRGERLIIVRNGKPIAYLTSAQARPQITLSELALQLADIKLPSAGFADDIEQLQKEAYPEQLPPWP